MLEKFSMTAIAEKLTALGGSGPLKSREWRIRHLLGWHTKAKSTVRHMLYGERYPSIDEAREIEAAHLKWCADKARQNAAENKALFREMRSALAAMESSDPEFYRPHIECVREMLVQFGHQTRENGTQD